MNQCHFIGQIVNHLTLEDVDKGEGRTTVVLRFQLSVNRKFRRNDGKLVKHNTILDCEAWDTGADVIARNFRRGDTIIVRCAARNVDDGVVFRVQEFEFPSSCGLGEEDE